ncbi:MAG: type II secretion system protein, partial [Pedosphaera parvula]|nr:type II secretion system protein [Pedosphaera parvula]
MVISVMGILAGLLMPVLSRAKDKGKQAVCQNNLHQIALGFALYHTDFNDQVPAPGSKKTYGPQPEDWIWWQYGRGVSNSTLGKYVEKFNPKIFTCPADREAKDLQAQGVLPN